ncbi:MAG: filamentous hemagglutinin N-terminal domain-containing protein, partial [Verrucomicrobiota bacterium]
MNKSTLSPEPFLPPAAILARRPSFNLYQIAAVFGVSFTLVAALATAEAGDILRGGTPAGAPRAGQEAGRVGEAASARARANAKDALSRTTQAVQAVQAMQSAARNLSRSGPNNLGRNPSQAGRILPNVPNGLGVGGLQVAPGVPVNLNKPVAGEEIKLWQGANLPSQSVTGKKTTVTIRQTAEQALLNWKTFNIGKETTLRFDQSKGGVNEKQWIAFNKVNDPTGVPSQILGSIEAGGQVYVINRNGIVFGGSSQINMRSFVATTLPLNDNLLTRGILNNPDAQFLLSALPLAAGTKGTPAFNPIISDGAFAVNATAASYTLAEQVALNSGGAPLRAPEFTFKAADGTKKSLAAGTDYTLVTDAVTRKVTATFTPDGLARIGDARVEVAYTPVVVKTGDIIVQPGARISSPVSADGNGGRVLLAAPNVRNEGTISTPAGQTILAAGRQVGLDAHKSSDPSLRGLDVYVGAVNVPGVTLPVA